VIPEGFIFSQSSLQSYLNCPRQFDLRYLKKLAWPAQKYADTEKYELDLAAGQTLHQAIQRYLIGFDEGLILEGLKAGSDTRIPIWFNNFRSRLGYLKDKAAFIAEVPVSISFEQFWLTAKFDYLSLENEQASIFDWKTSAKKPRKAQLQQSMQTKVYLTVAQGSRKGLEITVPKMRYWEANFPDLDFTFAPDEAAMNRHAVELKALISEISTQTELARTKVIGRCVYCKYRSYCNRGTMPGESASDEAFELAMVDGREEIESES
jgi:CRISPR/Cas system-associated exonuclease Cas4 (RecB family)